MDMREEVKRKAKKALSKPSIYGPDIDLEYYIKKLERESSKIVGFDIKDPRVQSKLESVGIDVVEAERSGSYYQVNHQVVSYYSKIPGVKVLTLEEAINEYWDIIKDYYWKAIPVDKDKYTATVELYGKGGYVIIVDDNVKIKQPLQTCLLLYGHEVLQAPHNIIILGENAEAHIITGCTFLREPTGVHLGVSEFYVGRGSKLTFTMIHGWGLQQHVRPRTGVIVEDEGEYISHYVVLSPPGTLQTYPQVKLKGKNTRAHVSSVCVGLGKSVVDVGSEIVLEGEGASGEIISRSLGKDNSTIIARGRIVGVAERAKGHLECMGLLLSNSAVIEAIPQLSAHLDDVELTHEASIGRIAEDEIYYLMSKGFTYDEAKSIIVRGFMSIEIKGIPKALKDMIDSVVTIISSKL